MPQFRQSGPEKPFPRLDPSAAAASDHVTLRIPHKHARIRRAGRRPSLPFVAAAFLLATFCALRYLSLRRETLWRSHDQDQNDVVKHEVQLDISSQSTNASRVLRFGHGSGADARDSRYWDWDDRRRNDEYEDGALDASGTDGGDDHDVQSKKNENELEKVLQDGEVAGSYNEVTRYELGKFEEKDKKSIDNVEQLGHRGVELQADPSDEYDDGLDVVDDIGDRVGIQEEDDHPKHHAKIRKSGLRRAIVNIKKSSAANLFGKIASGLSMKSHTNKRKGHGHGNLVVKGHGHGNIADSLRKASASNLKLNSKVKLRRRPSCEMKLLNSSKPQEPVDRSMKFASFSLQYTEEEEDKAYGVDNWEPRFAGHQSLKEREKSFHAHDQKINCGFINGLAGSPSTGFDLAEDDVSFMRSCQIAVSSCIFGNSDHLRSPYNKVITSPSKKSVCFVMFVDENTLETLSAEGQKPDSAGFIGLWKIVVVRNLPYDDMRRVGKIPKFLAHRLFPSARYSIWLDSKLRLQTDPLLILEYFLWRNGYEYAISNHYDRHCVWEEVMQNKKLNKFNHTIIDQQFAFYQTDGLKRFDPSDPNQILPSYVPEGSFIIRAHTPMSNLFSCLWFNEVDRFTPRDQLSFAYTFLKLRRMNPAIPFYLNMFKDCERRSIAKLFHHRAENSTSLLKQAVR